MTDTGRTLSLAGRVGERGEGDVVALDGESVAEWLADFNGQQVSVQFAFSDQPIDPERIEEAAVHAATGVLRSEYSVVWSEITGYLWTDEEGVVTNAEDGGSHDLVAIFEAHKGEYGYLSLTTAPARVLPSAKEDGG